MIQCDHMFVHRKPDTVVVDKVEMRGLIIDVAIDVPGDCRIRMKEDEKIEKYQDLKQEVIKMWKLKKVEIVPIVHDWNIGSSDL